MGAKTAGDERELLRRARDLDQKALAAVFDQYYESLYRFIYLNVREVACAQDLTAEVFQRFLSALHDGGGPRDYLRAWLFRVAYHLVVDEFRRRARLPETELTEVLQAGDPSPESRSQWALEQADIWQALDDLTGKQRSVLMLKYIIEMDNAEVARALALPISAVKSLQHRGLAAMRRRLGHLRTPELEQEAT